jgi:hypothetical protein
VIPSPFTAELAREHQSALVAQAGRPPRRSRWRPAVAALVAAARSVRPRPVTAACATC